MYKEKEMKNIKVFDVVELKNKEKGTILNVSGDNCLIEIVGDSKRHTVINKKEIEKVIYSK